MSSQSYLELFSVLTACSAFRDVSLNIRVCLENGLFLGAMPWLRPIYESLLSPRDKLVADLVRSWASRDNADLAKALHIE